VLSRLPERADCIARLRSSSPWLTEWTSIGLNEGITNAFVGPLDYFAGKVAVATESDGLFECDLGGDPFTGSTVCRRFSEESGFLVSNTVRVVKYAPDSTLWAGTNFGVSRWDPGTERFRTVVLPAGFGPDISAMEFDTRGICGWVHPTAWPGVTVRPVKSKYLRL